MFCEHHLIEINSERQLDIHSIFEIEWPDKEVYDGIKQFRRCKPLKISR
jgi:hypothetical protein